jgi:hypothetical protein
MDGVVNQCIMPKTNKIADWACLDVCLSILVATHTSVRTSLLLYLCLVTRDTSFCQEQVHVTVPFFFFDPLPVLDSEELRGCSTVVRRYHIYHNLHT